MENVPGTVHKSGGMESLFRALPDFKGKRRLGRYVFRNKIENGADITVKGQLDCIYKLPNLHEALAFDIFVNGIYEKHTHEFLVKHIPPGSTYLDLGMNIGSVAIPLLKRRTDIRCIGVEAAPWIFEYLLHNVKANGLQGRINCINKALADREVGPLPFYSPHGQFGKGSLSPVFTQDAIMVDTITIDNLLHSQHISRVGMIKIDIEGFEYFAFLGGSKLLQSADAPDIVFEFVDWAEEKANLAKGSAQELLLKYGYHLYTMKKGVIKPMKGIFNSGGAELFASKRVIA
jgi:FkbM family methyltransferase